MVKYSSRFKSAVGGLEMGLGGGPFGWSCGFGCAGLVLRRCGDGAGTVAGSVLSGPG